MLKESKEICDRLESIRKGDAAFILAVIALQQGDEAGCMKWLKLGEAKGTLPPKQYAVKKFLFIPYGLMSKVANKAWFKEITWGEGRILWP